MENNPTNTNLQTATTIPAASTLLSSEVFAALKRLIDYLWEEELRQVRGFLQNDDVVFDLIVLSDWMTNHQRDTDAHNPKR